MRTLPWQQHRRTSGLAIGILSLGLAASACGAATPAHRQAGSPADGSTAAVSPSGTRSPTASTPPTTLIGDGSTEDTGPQPHQPHPVRLKPGQEPPQFVVFSWDGAGGKDLFSRFRSVARANKASMTFFLSGVYALPPSKASLYDPPRHRRGASDIGFFSVDDIRDTMGQVGAAWLEGDEIGTHFNGHFCGKGGGGDWTAKEWRSEIQQARKFVETWRTNTGLTTAQAKPLPFNYDTELVGGRAPCLEGQKNLIPAAKAEGFRYDASSPGEPQVWPHQVDGIWNFPLQMVPFVGHRYEVLSMDYNFMANQSGTTHGAVAQRAGWEKQTKDSLLAGFQRAYTGNRAPLFIGNHFENWNGGIYMDAVEDVMKTVCTKKGVRCVSFKQLADWMDVQDPATLVKLRNLGMTKNPDWSALTS